MSTLNLHYPKHHPASSLVHLWESVRRLIPVGALVSSRSRARSSSRTRMTEFLAMRPRWSRESENPFDVPTNTYRDVIPNADHGHANELQK